MKSCPVCGEVLTLRMRDDVLVCGRCGAEYEVERFSTKYEGMDYMRQVKPPVAVPVFCERIVDIPGFPNEELQEQVTKDLIEREKTRLKDELARSLDEYTRVSVFHYPGEPPSRLRVRLSLRVLETGFVFR